MIKNKEKRERRKKTVPIWIGILVFIGAFIIGILSKLLIQPSSVSYTHLTLPTTERV